MSLRLVRRTRIAAALVAILAVGTLAAVTPTAASAADPGRLVDVTYTSYTSGEGSNRLAPQPSKTMVPVSSSTEMTVLVDPSITAQTYEGFGSTLEDTTIYHLMRLSASNRERALQALFSRENGNNFNLMRTTIGCADFCRTAKTTGFWTYADNGGQPDPTLSSFSIQRDIDDGKIEVIQRMLEINPDLRLFASMWSPPAWMKTNNSIIYSDNKNCSELPANANTVKHGAATGSDVDYYPVLAAYYVKYIQAYSALGIPISIVSLQNEPDIARTYPTNCWTPEQEADFAGVLRGALDAAELDVDIWGLDDNQHNTFPVSDALLADPADRQNIDGLGFHNYDGWPMWTPKTTSAMWPGVSTHLTEITQGANKIIEYFRAGLSSYTGWGMMFDFTTIDGVLYNAAPGWWQDQPVNTSDPDADTPPLITPKPGDPSDYQLNDYYYTFGAFSRNLQAGAVRLDSPDRMGNITNVAFRNPDGTIVVIVVNRGDTRYITTVEDTPAQTVRIATPDGEITDTIPGDTIATYTIAPSAGEPISRGGWSASASHTSDAYSATQAVDGQSTTRWKSGLNQAPGQSFTLDLGAVRQFDRVALNQMEQSTDYPAGYAVRVSTDGSTWSSPVASGAGTPSFTNIGFAPQTARYLRIELTASAPRWWSIGEVSVWDGSRGLLDLDGATATSSGSPSWASPTEALDGSMITAWTPAAPQASGQWFQVDLGRERAFDAVGLDSGGSAGDYPRHFDVQVSSNGSAWTTVSADVTGAKADTRIEIGAQSARYIRIALAGDWAGNWWAIREFRLYRSPSTADAETTLTPLSRAGWTATTSPAGWGSPSEAVDGALSTRWTTLNPATGGEHFQVDLGGTKTFRAVQVITTGPMEASVEFAREYEVWVSNGGAWTKVAKGTGYGPVLTAVFPPQTARYVHVKQLASGGAAWSIGEFQVLE